MGHTIVGSEEREGVGRAERGLVAGALEKLVVGVRGVEPEDGLARLHEEEEGATDTRRA